MPEQSVAAEIMRAVDAGFDEQLQLSQELVRCPSTRGQEASAQDLMARAARDFGYAVDMWHIDPDEIAKHPGFSPVDVSYENALTVVASWRPENPKGRSLILNGHVDVVPIGPEKMWTRAPFGAEIDGDWMYGRGAGDMKTGTVSALFALEALKRAGYRPGGIVHFESVIEEECTGNGALSTLVRGYKADAVLIPEPTGETFTQAQVGVVWMRVKVAGIPVHVAHAGSGQNAIEACIPLWNALHALEDEWNLPENKHPAFKDNAHPLNVVISQIEGGDWTSSVPAWCTFEVRVGLYPGVDPATIQARLTETIANASKSHTFLANNPPEIEWQGFLSPGYEVPEGTPGEPLLDRCHETVFGAPLGRRSSTALTDSRFHGIYNQTPSYVYGAIAENVHGFDERVNLPSVRRVTAAMALFIADWCGLEKI
ncbi:ArgE/DapE family deacylase [Nisaea denitrificans]|uniref:ArgE/DapE family deacylase n=1 Tax=Nisaea denitrificans TaxID=390877 RepID=UPI0003FFFE70|nr:ArgE/DapE family deacylase [Nisaea denitrificans]